MEAATLSTPQRKFNVVPIQKSLSLPSYARAGGEGIDHKLIFAALEQKERVRRKSKIFNREKVARPKIFCLPLPSGNKCRETSLSSDTSCSSLEYQKPKPVKKDKDSSKIDPNDKPLNEIESKPTSKPIKSNILAQNVQTVVKASTKVDDQRKGYRSPIDTLRLNVGSSDSMDRSSRSSTDSFSRKERLVALKARVEAAREKYGNSSSEEECPPTMTRYNSDGSIHKTGRDYKSRSSRQERRFRRRSQDEFAIKKNMLKNDLKFSLNSIGVNGVQLSLEKSSRLEIENNNLEVKTDICSSPSFQEFTKKNYFSDFPSRECPSRFVQTRIRHLENEESKRRSGTDFREKIRTPPRQSPQSVENSSPVSVEHRFPFEKQNGSNSNTLEKHPSFTEHTASSSPIPRSAQAPTPPPRSPKSKTFLTKNFMHHQNSSVLLNQGNSMDRRIDSQPKILTSSYNSAFEKFNAQSNLASTRTALPVASTFTEKQNIRELIANRRKTCGNFDFIDMNLLDDLIATSNSNKTSNSLLNANKKFSSVSQIKRNESKEGFHGSETSCLPSEEDFRSKLWKSKWQENEQRREFIFNSLEAKPKTNSPPSSKWGSSPSKSDDCICLLFPNDQLQCPCKSKPNKSDTNAGVTDPLLNTENFSLVSVEAVPFIPVKTHSSRPERSEINRISREQIKSPSSGVKREKHLLSQIFEDTLASKRQIKSDNLDKYSATANLESAMEELENVYRSLKITSDNLLERNGTWNTSACNDDVKVSNYKNQDCREQSGSKFKRNSISGEGNFNFETLKTNYNSNNSKDCDISTDPKSELVNLGSSISMSSSETTSHNQLSIDELFNGLTQQLDLMEQKLLKEPVENPPRTTKSHLSVKSGVDELSINESFDGLTQQLDWERKLMEESRQQRSQQNKPSKKETASAKNMSLSESLDNLTQQLGLEQNILKEPRESKPQKITSESKVRQNRSPQVSVRKEFFDNLCKNAQNKNDVSTIKGYSPLEPNLSINKKKYKAVRSLSENISCLMASEPKVTMDNRTVIKKTETDNCALPYNDALKETYPKYLQRVSTDSLQNSSKQENVFNQSHIFVSQADNTQADANPKREEIRNIRVSMDTNALTEESLDSEKYPRLSCAVSSQIMAKPRDCTQETQLPLKEDDSPNLDETGLEKLLNSLLGETPESRESSRLLSPPTPPPATTGEMSVLQHLDVIRLKPVPS